MASAEAATGEAPRVVTADWSDLEFGVRRFLVFSGRLGMTRRTATYPGEGEWNGQPVTLIETESRGRAFGHEFPRVLTRSWIDPSTGSTLLYEERKVGVRTKRVTFGPAEFREEIRRPGAEGDGDEATWPVERDRKLPYALIGGTPIEPGSIVRDYYNMVAALGRQVREGRRVEQYLVVTKGRVVRFLAELGEEVERKWELEDAHGEELGRLKLRLRRLRLTPVGEDPSDLGGFFAMEGGTQIWLDARTGAMVAIVGKVPDVPGRTEIRLQAVSFGGRPVRETLVGSAR